MMNCPCDPQKWIPRVCYSGDPATKGKGACKAGKQYCDKDTGRLGPCDDEVVPSDEVCNGVDDDCDGVVDNVLFEDAGVLEVFEDQPINCYVTGKQGLCAKGTYGCQDGKVACKAVLPDPPDGQAPGRMETCNNEDDDCNGTKDDVPWDGQKCMALTNADGGTAFGECRVNGKRTCLSSGCNGKPCESCVAGDPKPESCSTSGIAADEDCDNKIDVGACKSTPSTPWCCRFKGSGQAYFGGCQPNGSSLLSNSSYTCCDNNGCMNE
jgi:hypothetical protein